jgi:hypothetical protein
VSKADLPSAKSPKVPNLLKSLDSEIEDPEFNSGPGSAPLLSC